MSTLGVPVDAQTAPEVYMGKVDVVDVGNVSDALCLHPELKDKVYVLYKTGIMEYTIDDEGRLERTNHWKDKDSKYTTWVSLEVS